VVAPIKLILPSAERLRAGVVARADFDGYKATIRRRGDRAEVSED
jgi:hypothetical protein